MKEEEFESSAKRIASVESSEVDIDSDRSLYPEKNSDGRVNSTNQIICLHLGKIRTTGFFAFLLRAGLRSFKA